MTYLQVEDAVDFFRGITFKPSDILDIDSPEAVVCFRTKNVQEKLDDKDLIAIPKKLVKTPNKILQPGDILISIANSWELVGKREKFILQVQEF